MKNISDAFKYGPAAGMAILVVYLVVALIKRKDFNRNIFWLTVAVAAVLLVFLTLYVARDMTQTHSAAPVISAPPPKAPVGDHAGTSKSVAPQPPRHSMLDVRGRVTPVPKQPAFVSIDGTPGKWPIDHMGSFSFKIPSRERSVTVVVIDGDGRTQSGFYYISDAPLRIAFNPGR